MKFSHFTHPMVGCLLALGSAGCKVYLERETAPGTVPRPPAMRPIVPTPLPTEHDASGPAPNKSVAKATDVVIEGFRKAYTGKNSPRIAVFLDRKLSDDVREWQADVRAIVAAEAENIKQETEDRRQTNKQDTSKGAVGAYVERRVAGGERRLDVGEGWKWAFEDGFVQPLLRAKVKVVDRATIVRLAAVQGPERALQPRAVKHIEMQALKGYADIFVEVLVSRSPAARYGYEFKASAKEVETGNILANVTSLDWNNHPRRGRTVAATSNGYKIVNTASLPQVRDVASDLAIDLMHSLTAFWSQ